MNTIILSAVILTAPLGIDLGPDPPWRIDRGQQRTLIFNTCTHVGCFATASLSDQRLAELRRELTLALQNRNVGAHEADLARSLKRSTAGIYALNGVTDGSQ